MPRPTTSPATPTSWASTASERHVECNFPARAARKALAEMDMKRGAWLRGHMLGLALLLGGRTWAGELTDAGTPVADAGGPGEPDEKPAMPRSEPPASCSPRASYSAV